MSLATRELGPLKDCSMQPRQKEWKQGKVRGSFNPSRQMAQSSAGFFLRLDIATVLSRIKRKDQSQLDFKIVKENWLLGLFVYSLAAFPSPSFLSTANAMSLFPPSFLSSGKRESRPTVPVRKVVVFSLYLFIFYKIGLISRCLHCGNGGQVPGGLKVAGMGHVPLVRVNEAHVVEDRGGEDADVEDLVAVEPEVKLARPAPLRVLLGIEKGAKEI